MKCEWRGKDGRSMLREAIILAAGMGTRLSIISNGKPKFLIEILGRPLIFFPILMLLSIGVESIGVIVPRGWKDDASRVLKNNFDVDFRIIENDDPKRDNGYSFLLSREITSEDRFILTMCDHIIPHTLALHFLKKSEREREAHVLVAGDRRPKYVDIEEATRILATEDGGLVVKISKNLPVFNYVDIGLFIFSRETYEVAEKLASRVYVMRLSDIIIELLRSGYKVRVIDITNNPWTEIDTVDDYFSAHFGRKREVINMFLDDLRKCDTYDEVNRRTRFPLY